MILFHSLRFDFKHIIMPKDITPCTFPATIRSSRSKVFDKGRFFDHGFEAIDVLHNTVACKSKEPVA